MWHKRSVSHPAVRESLEEPLLTALSSVILKSGEVVVEFTVKGAEREGKWKKR